MAPITLCGVSRPAGVVSAARRRRTARHTGSTNENGNGLIRRYVGKGTNLAVYRPEHLRAIEHRINTMPRRIHHWSTAAQVYDAAVPMTG